MFEPTSRYVTCGINENLPDEIQMMLWLSIDSLRITDNDKLDYLQVFSFRRLGDTFEITHKQEEPDMVHTHHTKYKDEYENLLSEKVFVIDDGDHSTMLFAYEY